MTNKVFFLFFIAASLNKVSFIKLHFFQQFCILEAKQTEFIIKILAIFLELFLKINIFEATYALKRPDVHQHHKTTSKTNLF